MNMTTPRVRVKICCIASAPEVTLAVRYGASALGLVSAMPSGPGVIADERIRELAGLIPPGVASFLLTCEPDADAIIAQQRRARVTTLQLVDYLPPETLATLRAALPGIGLVQVIHVLDAGDVERAKAAAPLVDALLLDSGNPNLTIKELGGTGRIHDWSISRAIVAAVDKPVFLAGGLNPENVAEAIQTVRPFGVDICGGVRRNGKLDEGLLRRFMRACGALGPETDSGGYTGCGAKM